MTNSLKERKRRELESQLTMRYTVVEHLAQKKLIPPSVTATELYTNPDDGKPFSFDGYKYIVEPLDSTQWRVVIRKPNQVGATVMGQIWSAYMLDVQRKSLFYLLPTTSDARDFVSGRFNNLLRCARLQNLFKTDTVGHKKGDNINFYCRGSNSRSRLMMVPADALVIDEFDECHTSYDITSEEGSWSSIDLVRKRLTGREETWERDISTPTAPDVGIDAEWALSDQRFWVVPCGHCSWWGVMDWQQVKWKVKETREASFECPKCKRAWTREERTAYNNSKKAQWDISRPGRDIHGYQLSQLMSCRVRLADMAREWEESQGNEAKITVFHNGRLGLPYQPATTKLDAETVRSCMMPGTKCLTKFPASSYMGVDTGSIHYYVILGVDRKGYIAVLARGKLDSVDHVDAVMTQYQVARCCIDAAGEPEAARKLAERHPYKVYRVTYSEKIAGEHIRTDEAKQLKTVNRTESLDATFQRIRLGYQDLNGIILPEDIGDEFVQHLCAQKRVLIRHKKTGKIIARYIDSGKPDHFAHALNYGLIGIGRRIGHMEWDLVGEIA